MHARTYARTHSRAHMHKLTETLTHKNTRTLVYTFIIFIYALLLFAILSNLLLQHCIEELSVVTDWYLTYILSFYLV